MTANRMILLAILACVATVAGLKLRDEYAAYQFRASMEEQRAADAELTRRARAAVAAAKKQQADWQAEYIERSKTPRCQELRAAIEPAQLAALQKVLKAPLRYDGTLPRVDDDANLIRVRADYRSCVDPGNKS